MVNRVHEIGDSYDEATISAALARRGLALDSGASARIAEAARQERRLGELDRLHMVAIEEVFDVDSATNPSVLHVPEFPLDIHDVRRLAWVADVIASSE